METINTIDSEEKTVFMIISHKYKGLKGIVVSGKKVYQLPCSIGMRTYNLKEIIKRKGFWLIKSDRYSTKQLKELSYKRADKFIINNIPLYLF
ncbi:unnamed protein product [marine sediment metagenome]|uniref:Uncharacterized protein n=1 Tax=marine sediment metagenome TaxID=412755 RepID=X0TIG8_9ZZZZ